jgi:hypothetical protein
MASVVLAKQVLRPRPVLMGQMNVILLLALMEGIVLISI